MEIDNIENATVDLGIALNSMGFLIEEFDDSIDCEYVVLLSKNRNLFYKLRSYEFLFRQVLRRLKCTENKYNREIRRYYAEL